MSTTQTTLFATNLAPVLQAMLQQQRLCQQAANVLDAADLHVIAHVFRFTAAQESEHAAILTGLLGTRPPQHTDAPTPGVTSPALWLSAAIESESTCAGELLPEAARSAAQVGLGRTADALLRIAENDRRHALRFRQCLLALEDGSLLHSAAPTSWFCLACGGLHHGCDAPAHCESCGALRGHFIRSSFHPFTVQER